MVAGAVTEPFPFPGGVCQGRVSEGCQSNRYMYSAVEELRGAIYASTGSLLGERLLDSVMSDNSSID